MDKVEYILTHYNDLKDDLAMLRYRLEHFKPVTENEVIGSLVFEKFDQPIVTGTKSNHRSELMALGFREKMIQEDAERLSDLSQRYFHLANDLENFDLAIRFLKGELQDFARRLLEPDCNWDRLMSEFHISRSTVRNWRQKVLDHVRGVYLKMGFSKK